MKNLIIIGAGGFARGIYWMVQKSLGYGVDWQIKGFLDGNVKLSAKEYELLPEKLLGNVNTYEICDDDVFTCGVGNFEARKVLIEKILSRGGQFINLISELAEIYPTAEIGRGVIISPFVGISDSVKIGDFVLVNAHSIIGHDSCVGDFSSIMLHVSISSNCKIGSDVFIGSGSVILPKAKIKDGAKIGAGSVVLKKVRAGSTIFTEPAVEL